MKKLISLIVIIAASYQFLGIESASAQASNSQVPWTDTTHIDYNRWYVGGLFGVYQFYGDVSENTFFTGGAEYGYFNGMWGLRAGREFNQQFGARLNFNMGKMSSSKQDLWFEAQVRNIGLDFTLNLTNIIAPYIYNKKWNSTVFVGAGFMGYRSQLYNGAANDSIMNSVGYDANGDKGKLIKKTYFTLGTDLAYKISPHLDIFLEAAITNVPVDDLDAKFVVLSELDNYSHIALGLHYTFGKHEEAYKWNPKPDYLKAMEEKIVDMGNDVEASKICCEEKNKINPCDTSTADGDGDLVPDCRDFELDSPKGSIVNFQGIALVSPDSTGTPTTVAASPGRRGSGAPAVFFSPVFFEYDKTAIDSTGDFLIINVALYMKQFPDARILISGNTDIHASDKYNEGLSNRRCKKVYKILTEDYGIEANRLEMQPNGKRLLLFPKDHANRRVDFTVIQ